MKTTRTFRARWIFHELESPLANGFITVQDGTIVGVSNRCDEPYEDLGEVAILPGLINAHTHLEFSELTQPLGEPNIEFTKWLRLVIANRMETSVEAKRAAIQLGFDELKTTGTVAAGEIATEPWTAPNLNSEQNAGCVTQLVAFLESIGLAESRFETLCSQSAEHLQTQNGFIAGLSPHAPYTVHPSLFDSLIAMALGESAPVAVHLAETKEELQCLSSNTGPFREFLEGLGVYNENAFAESRSAIWYLQRLAPLPRAIIVHGNYLTEDELAFMARHASSLSLCYCPRTHAFFGHDPYPLRQALDLGVHVTLGTDSRASNPDLSIWNEFQQVLRKHSNVKPAEALKLITINGALALGMEDRFGSLVIGKSDQVAILPLNTNHLDPYEAIVEVDQPPSLVCLSQAPLP